MALLQENHLYLGDCLEVMQDWPDESIDHCIIDPPYNISRKNGLGWAFSTHVTMNEDWDVFTRKEFFQFNKEWLNLVHRVVKRNGNIFVFGSFHNIYDLGFLLNEMDLRIINSIVWFKPNAQPNITGRTLTESTEYIIWACNETKAKASNWQFDYQMAKKLNHGKQMRNLWQIPYPSITERKYGKHPSQKPLELISRIMLIATKPDDLVLDCFAGSGTTGVVAKSFSRKWIMIEKNPEYFEIAQKRLAYVRVPYPQELLQPRLNIDGEDDLDSHTIDGV